MAPPTMYEPPHVQLGKLMIEARRAGDSFPVFWARAMRPGKTIVMVTHEDPPEGAIRWPTDKADRQQWQAALVSAESGWRRAYERRAPTRSELAIERLGELLFGDEEDAIHAPRASRQSLMAA